MRTKKVGYLRQQFWHHRVKIWPCITILKNAIVIQYIWTTQQYFYSYVTLRFFLHFTQDWEFAHRIFERITRFLPKKWATWAICSQSLIPSEQPEQIAHGRSFVLSDLSDSLISHRTNERNLCFLKNFQKTVKT